LQFDPTFWRSIAAAIEWIRGRINVERAA